MGHQDFVSIYRPHRECGRSEATPPAAAVNEAPAEKP